MDLESCLKQLEESANQVAKDWHCIHCNEVSLKYLRPDVDADLAGGEDYGIVYKCESCGAVNKWDEVRHYARNKKR